MQYQIGYVMSSCVAVFYSMLRYIMLSHVCYITMLCWLRQAILCHCVILWYALFIHISPNV